MDSIQSILKALGKGISAKFVPVKPKAKAPAKGKAPHQKPLHVKPLTSEEKLAQAINKVQREQQVKDKQKNKLKKQDKKITKEANKVRKAQTDQLKKDRAKERWNKVRLHLPLITNKQQMDEFINYLKENAKLADQAMVKLIEEEMRKMIPPPLDYDESYITPQKKKPSKREPTPIRDPTNPFYPLPPHSRDIPEPPENDVPMVIVPNAPRKSKRNRGITTPVIKTEPIFTPEKYYEPITETPISHRTRNQRNLHKHNETDEKKYETEGSGLVLSKPKPVYSKLGGYVSK